MGLIATVSGAGPTGIVAITGELGAAAATDDAVGNASVAGETVVAVFVTATSSIRADANDLLSNKPPRLVSDIPLCWDSASVDKSSICVAPPEDGSTEGGSLEDALAAPLVSAAVVEVTAVVLDVSDSSLDTAAGSLFPLAGLGYPTAPETVSTAVCGLLIGGEPSVSSADGRLLAPRLDEARLVGDVLPDVGVVEVAALT